MNRGTLYYLMAPLLLLLSLLQSTSVARFKVAGIKPDLVLLFVIIGALVYGARPGVLWAFIAGIGLDIFSSGPLGVSSLALMASALVAGLGHRPLSRFNILVPLTAAALGTLAYAAVYLTILAILVGTGMSSLNLPLLDTIRDIVLPVTLYNTALMLLALPWLNRLPESQDL
ncbi:rod shape-determining protein MreD [Caldilinea sp.]|uniref:rod shape-determining protein MreD n=1 Tax=Caldilinea sp. TaxID=2293560 RepID=UPI002B562F81|nr:rod shape-determining protein MreD [Anaerolineales bacterium]HQY93795.1 rod shape-determining protein MreD [Caldilinea sp.]